MHTILVVDDDPHIREVIRFALEQDSMRVLEAENGIQALEAMAESPADLVVLDILMPEMDGFSVCRELRKNSRAPILFLSSRSDEIDKVLGLELGGDDYVTKPFSPRELVARVRAILRRLDTAESDPAQAAPSAERLGRGLLEMDTESHTAQWKGREIQLTATEFSLLLTFLRRPERAFDRDALMDAAYDHAVTVSLRTIDSHIRGIRAKFAAQGGQDVIATVHGVGYKLGSCT